ncbi:MAG: hypothetical protein ACXQS8_04470, partial [Candidatus Helarchaeales archaeon]
MKKIYVLDTSAFIGGLDPTSLTGIELVTVDGVIDEILSLPMRMKVELALKLGHLKLMSPTKKAIETVRQACKESGDLKSLSIVDISVLALGMEIKNSGDETIDLSDDN